MKLPYKIENVIKYVENEFEIDVKYNENTMSDAPKMATCRYVNRRNIGPFSKPLKNDNKFILI